MAFLISAASAIYRKRFNLPVNHPARSQREFMDGRSIEEIRDELAQLMLAQIESLKDQTFVGVSREELRQQDVRLKRIREVSAELLAALKRIAL